ncbi:MAG: hypothetical protein ACKV19_08005, partial [Verrucomicrobiales bacterium]
MTDARRGDDWEASPPERLDEAFAWLRALPGAAVAWWIVGAAPMVLGVLSFWADRTRGGDGEISAAGWAAGLVAVYVWMKVTQAYFARAVWGSLLPGGALPVMSVGEWFGRTGALLAFSVLCFPAWAMAVPLVIPVAWVSAFFHHGTVLAYTHDVGSRPWRELLRQSARLAHHEPLGHHLCLLQLGVLGGLVWGAVAALGLILPFLVKIMTGIESDFTRNPLASSFNALYLMATVGVTWLLISPYFRVYYVLRTFQGLSRRTGDDLLSRLHAAGLKTRLVIVVTLFSMGLGLGAMSAAAESGEGNPVPQAESGASGVPSDPAPLAEAIRETLTARDYQWRLPMGDAAESPGENSWVAALKRAMDQIGRMMRDFDRWIGNADRLIRRWFGGAGPGSTDEGAGSGMAGSALRGTLILALVGLLIGGVVLAIHLRRRRRQAVPASAPAATATRIDLSDETTLANALPEDEWLRLARDQWQAGDARLAVRAVFLATLAALGDQGLIAIGLSKSNRDYAMELRLRAPSRREVPEIFGGSVALFERAWYGLHQA